MIFGCARKQRGSSLAEFGPVLWLFLIFFVIPLLDLLSFLTGAGSVMLMSNWGVRQAASTMTFTQAQASVLETEQRLLPFLKFAKAVPSGGGANGCTIRVLVTPIDDATTAPPGSPYSAPGTIPNSPPSAANPNVPVHNTGNCVYQYVATSAFDVLPLFNFSGTPFLNGVPGLGQAVPVTFSTTATVEHPDGLNN